MAFDSILLEFQLATILVIHAYIYHISILLMCQSYHFYNLSIELLISYTSFHLIT